MSHFAIPDKLQIILYMQDIQLVSKIECIT